MTKENAPQNHPEGKNQSDDSLVVVNLLEFADSLLEEWRPYLLSEGEMLLGREVSINRAFLEQLKGAVLRKDTDYKDAMAVLTKEVVALRKDLNTYKKGYEELCKIHDQWKSNFFEISSKQKDHIEITNNRLRAGGL